MAGMFKPKPPSAGPSNFSFLSSKGRHAPTPKSKNPFAGGAVSAGGGSSIGRPKAVPAPQGYMKGLGARRGGRGR